MLILERGNYLLFNRIHHCRKKDACRPLIYIDDIDLKHILGDILGLYQNNRVIRNKIFNYSKSINLQIKEREPESYKPKIKSQSYIEGDTTEIIAEIKKRDKKLINDAKRKYGFICSVCGFDFMKAYGTQYIEIHHLFPLSKSRRKLTKLENVRPVCANCHRIIHKSKNSMIDIEDLRQIVNVKFEY